MVDLGKRLKELRLQRELTQQQVAERIWVSKAMISAYELAIRSPSFEVLIKLANLYNVSTDYLLGLQNDTAKRRMIDVSGLTDDQLVIVNGLIENMRKHNE